MCCKNSSYHIWQLFLTGLLQNHQKFIFRVLVQQKAKHGYITNIVTLKGKCSRVVHKATRYHLLYNFSVPYYFHRWKVQLYSLPSFLPRTPGAWGTLPSLAVITCLEQLCVNCLPLRSLAVFIKVKWTLLSDDGTFFFSVWFLFLILFDLLF